jgi:hypothetical protein
MNLEIHKPELVERVNARIQSGHFHDVDELIEKALDALDERAPRTPPTETGAVVLAALQASPYPEIDITPPRVRLGDVRDVVLWWRGCWTPIFCRKAAGECRTRE